MKKCAIFDLDGTLLNTLDDLAAACNHALRLHGLPVHPVDAYKLFVGNGVYKLIERTVSAELRGDTALLGALKAGFDDYYQAHSIDLTAPYEGVLPMLDELCARKVMLMVLSNKPHVFTCELTKQFFGDRMQIVHGQREGYPTKPDRALVTELLGLAGVDAADSIYIGDSGVDMQTARNGGVFAVGALWGFRGRQELEENGADACIALPGELIELL